MVDEPEAVEGATDGGLAEVWRLVLGFILYPICVVVKFMDRFDVVGAIID